MKSIADRRTFYGEIDMSEETVEEVIEVVDGSTGETVYKEQASSPVFGIISLILGIVSLLCGCCGICCASGWLGVFIAVSSIVLGIISITKDEDSKGLAVAGIVCGSVGLVILIIVILMSDQIVDYVLHSFERTGVDGIFEQIEDL